MKSYIEIFKELTSSYENLDAFIKIISNALEPYGQKKELRKALVLIKFEDGNNIFHYSCIKKSDLLKQILLENDLIPMSFLTKPNPLGSTPLSLAVQHNDYNFVKFSLENGANPNELAGPAKQSLLELAGAFMQPEIIRLLVQYKANVARYGSICMCHFFERFSQAEIPLTLQKKRTQVLQLLINHGANVCDGMLLRVAEKEANIFHNVSDEELSILRKETTNRRLLNKTIHLFLLGTLHDPNSNFYGLPKEITKEISSYTRNQTK